MTKRYIALLSESQSWPLSPERLLNFDLSASSIPHSSKPRWTLMGVCAHHSTFVEQIPTDLPPVKMLLELALTSRTFRKAVTQKMRDWNSQTSARCTFQIRATLFSTS